MVAVGALLCQSENPLKARKRFRESGFVTIENPKNCTEAGIGCFTEKLRVFFNDKKTGHRLEFVHAVFPYRT